MPHVVILTPKGADVAAGKEALEKAGFDVEVVDAEAANLIHIASGMLEGEQEAAKNETAEEPAGEEDAMPADLELPAEEPSEDTSDSKKKKGSEDKKKQANENFIGMVNIEDEAVPAYLGQSNVLWAGNLKRNSEMANKISFALNESIVSIWKDAASTKLKLTVNGTPVQAKLMEAKGKTKLVVCEKTAKKLKMKK